jgi:hypothetical protein
MPRLVNLANFQQFTSINVLSDPGVIGGPVVIPNCIQITLVWANDAGKQARNVIYGQAAGGFLLTPAVAQAILSGLSSGASWTAMAAFMSTTSSLFRVDLRDVRVANSPLVSSTAVATPGTSASPALPAEVAAVITLRTAKAGTGNRGRIFVPGWATNALGTGNIIAAGAVTALGNWANTIPTVLTGQALTFALGQPARAAYVGSTGTSHPARAAGSLTITTQTVRDNHWDTIRRRGLK